MPLVGIEVLSAIAAAGPSEFFVRPGAESNEWVMKAKRLSLNRILAYSIGRSQRFASRLPCVSCAPDERGRTVGCGTWRAIARFGRSAWKTVENDAEALLHFDSVSPDDSP